MFYERGPNGDMKPMQEVIEGFDTPFGRLSLDIMYERVDVPLLLALD